MNRLFLLRGIPGCGKSTLVDTLKLKDYTISTDDLRMKFCGLETDENGLKHISQKKNNIVFAVLFQTLEKRMKQNKDTIIDATNIGSFGKFEELASTYNFKIFIVDFNISLEEALERNKHRDFRNVPEEVVKKMYESKIKKNIPEYFTIINSNEMEHVWKEET